jgi:hypothetical protein
VPGNIVVQLTRRDGAELHEQTCGRKGVEAGRNAQIIRKPLRREELEGKGIAGSNAQNPAGKAFAGFDWQQMQEGAL